MKRFVVLYNDGQLAGVFDTLSEARARATDLCRRNSAPFAVYESVAICRPTETPVEWETLGMAAQS